MKIVSPVPYDGHLAPLINLGLKEFYFGYIPLYWKNKYSLINSINRRYTAKEQFFSKKAISKLMREHGNEDIKFYIVFNAQLYTTEQIDSIIATIRDFQKARLSGVIVADIGLIIKIKKEFPGLRVHISCLAVSLNSEAIKFFKKLGADRIILPRSVSLQAMKRIRKNNPDIELETIFTTMDCVNIDGFCTHHHCSDGFQPCAEEKGYLQGEKIIKVERDLYLRVLQLDELGIDYIKFPRRGDDALEFIKKNKAILSLMKKTSVGKG